MAEIDGENIPERQKNALRAKIINANMDIQGNENPYNSKGFQKLFTQIIFEEQNNGIQPSVGQVHDWSPEIREAFPRHMTMRFSKLLTCLALGVSSKYLVTGQEQSLRAFLLLQENNTVTFEKIFRQSYRLNQGNIYLSLLTIENLLSANWKAPIS